MISASSCEQYLDDTVGEGAEEALAVAAVEVVAPPLQAAGVSVNRLIRSPRDRGIELNQHDS